VLTESLGDKLVAAINKQALSRRAFGRLCVGLGSTFSVAMIATTLSSPSASSARVSSGERKVKFRNGAIVPALGQGSMRLGQGGRSETDEQEALRTGFSLGMKLIDTAELYGGGRSEEFVGRVIAGQRDRLFVVSKVLPRQAAGDGIKRSCEASLARLGTNHIDLYLLHWRDKDTDLKSVVTAFESLRAEKKIRAWGVSNFGVGDLEDLFRIRDGDRCATNQVPYSLSDRNIERALLPWCERHKMPVMAYTPLGNNLLRDPTLARIAAEHGCSAAAVALAWVIRSGNVIAIPESGSASHVKENAAALSLVLSARDLQALDAAHPLSQK